MIAVRIALTDDARTAERERHLEAHKAYLRSAGVRILQSGPFKAPGRAGALIIAEVDDLAAMHAFSNADPFVVHGVYRSVEIVEWTVTLSAEPPQR